MEVFALEVAGALSDRALEVSFASALSTVSYCGYHTDSVEDNKLLQAQLLQYTAYENECLWVSWKSYTCQIKCDRQYTTNRERDAWLIENEWPTP